MTDHAVVSQDDWLRARTQLLTEEKEFTRLRDRLSQRRRDLPWVKVDKPYVFDGPDGPETLAELFEGRRQLIVYHFMFDPEWEAGCRGCSFWADNFNGITVHLNQRDATFIAVSRAPLAKLQAFRQRMGWSFNWVSSMSNDFNFDFNVSFTPDVLATGEIFYNFDRREMSASELPGISVFYRDDDGGVFRTYSCYARGLDMLNGAYHYLDLLPRGRDEGPQHPKMTWVRLHDEYGA